MDNDIFLNSKAYKTISASVNWSRAILSLSIIWIFCLIYELIFTLTNFLSFGLFMFFPLFFFSPSYWELLLEYSPSIEMLYLSEAILCIAIISKILSFIFALTTLIKLNSKDLLIKELNDCKTVIFILMLFFPFVLSIVWLVKVKNIDLDKEKESISIDNQIKTTSAKHVVNDKIKYCKKWIITNSIYYGSAIAIVIILISTWNLSAVVGLDIILFDILYVSIGVFFIIYIVNLVKDIKTDYHIPSLDNKKKGLAWLTFFFRITGYCILLKKLKKAAAKDPDYKIENNSTSVKIVTEWDDENGYHWGMDSDKQYYYFSDNQWIKF